MVVEIKRTDTPEEIKEKLKAINAETSKKQQIAEEERKQRLMKFFGAIKTELDPLEIQRQLRNEWD